MKVAVSVEKKSLDAAVDPRFGRCAQMILVDTETMEIVGGGPNEAATAPGGAGTLAAQWVADLGAEAVVTGNVGPNAFNVLNAAGIHVFTNAKGTAREAIQSFLENKLGETSEPTAPRKSGMA